MVEFLLLVSYFSCLRANPNLIKFSCFDLLWANPLIMHRFHGAGIRALRLVFRGSLFPVTGWLVLRGSDENKPRCSLLVVRGDSIAGPSFGWYHGNRSTPRIVACVARPKRMFGSSVLLTRVLVLCVVNIWIGSLCYQRINVINVFSVSLRY